MTSVDLLSAIGGIALLVVIFYQRRLLRDERRKSERYQLTIECVLQGLSNLGYGIIVIENPGNKLEPSHEIKILTERSASSVSGLPLPPLPLRHLRENHEGEP